jgi:6-phosphogluconolactonase
MPTRRRFLALFPAFATAPAFATLSFHRKKPLPPALPFLYIGTVTNKTASKGIYQCRFDPVQGKLSAPILAATVANPTFLALSPARGGHRLIYAASATSTGVAAVTSFGIEANGGGLKQVGQVPIGGDDPVYLSIDPTDRVAFVANYESSLSTFRVLPDGTLSQPVEHLDFKDRQRFGPLGQSPHQEDSHPHCAVLSPDGRFLLVADLGTDHVSVFVVDPETARLTGPHLFTNNHPGAGPRHIVFHPNARWVYIINELDSTIDRCLWTATRFSDTPQGLLVNTNTPVKTIAEDFPVGRNAAAEVLISADGSFLYASNRGENTLAVFSIGMRDGSLKMIQSIACGGKTPNNFTLSPNGQWLLCSNQNSASITVFRRDAASGKLSGPTQTLAIASPMFTLFA